MRRDAGKRDGTQEKNRRASGNEAIHCSKEKTKRERKRIKVQKMTRGQQANEPRSDKKNY